MYINEDIRADLDNGNIEFPIPNDHTKNGPSSAQFLDTVNKWTSTHLLCFNLAKSKSLYL